MHGRDTCIFNQEFPCPRAYHLTMNPRDDMKHNIHQKLNHRPQAGIGVHDIQFLYALQRRIRGLLYRGYFKFIVVTSLYLPDIVVLNFAPSTWPTSNERSLSWMTIKTLF